MSATLFNATRPNIPCVDVQSVHLVETMRYRAPDACLSLLESWILSIVHLRVQARRCFAVRQRQEFVPSQCCTTSSGLEMSIDRTEVSEFVPTQCCTSESWQGDVSRSDSHPIVCPYPMLHFRELAAVQARPSQLLDELSSMRVFFTPSLLSRLNCRS